MKNAKNSSVVKSHKKVKKTRPTKRKRPIVNNSYKLSVTLLREQSNGASNWDKLSKVLGYDLKIPKMAENIHSTGVFVPPRKNHFQRKTIVQKTIQHLPTDDKNNSVHKSDAGFSNHSENIMRPTSKPFSKKYPTIRDIGNCLPACKNESRQSVNFHKTMSGEQNLPDSKAGCSIGLHKSGGITNIVAMDCEMVGTGQMGEDSMVARVSIVNKFGDCIYDAYVKPKDTITDYRTSVSGIRPSDLINGKDLFLVQRDVLNILEGHILVGHALKNDLDVLFISHPMSMIRDTSRYKPIRQLFDGRTPSLKKLASKFLGVEIQSGEHSSVEDAQAAMQIYLIHKHEWEKSLKQNRKKRPPPKKQEST